MEKRKSLGRRQLSILWALLVMVTATTQRVAGADLTLGLKASANLDVTAGLDEPTRNLIASLPSEIRSQLLQLLREALPLVDQSVNTYLTRANQIINDQVDHFSCAIVGSVATTRDLFKHVIAGRPRPIQELESLWLEQATAFTASTAPHRLALSYEDFLFNATTTACQVTATPQAAARVAGIQAQARAKWAVWVQLEGKCSTPKSCVETQLKNVTVALASSDRRDVDAVQGTARLSTVRVPEDPGFFSRFRQAPYENALATLFAITDSVELARQVREARGKAQLVQARAILKAAEDALQGARGTLSEIDLESNTRALQSCALVSRDQEDMKKVLAQAVAETSKLTEDAASVGARYQALQSEVPRIAETAQRNQEIIRVRRVVEEVARGLGIMRFPQY